MKSDPTQCWMDVLWQRGSLGNVPWDSLLQVLTAPSRLCDSLAEVKRGCDGKEITYMSSRVLWGLLKEGQMKLDRTFTIKVSFSLPLSFRFQGTYSVCVSTSGKLLDDNFYWLSFWFSVSIMWPLSRLLRLMQRIGSQKLDFYILKPTS